jgi:hypothetical protein
MAKQPFLTIASFPGQVIEISCARCGRRSLWTRARLARTYGDETSIPELIRRLSENCSFRQDGGGAQCRAAVRLPGSPPPDQSTVQSARPSKRG